MEHVKLLLLVFMFVAYAFCFGIEYGRRIRSREIMPWNRHKPRFRLIYKNPSNLDRKKSR